MIKVVEYKKPQGMQPEDLITYGLYADTKAEVTEDATIVGMEAGEHIPAGSYVYTGDGNVAFRTSEDSWAWQ